MREKVLIHCTSIKGHHLEYIHHLYIGASQRTNIDFVFCLPESFNSEKHLYKWPVVENIVISYLDDITKDVDDLGLLKKAYLKTVNLKKNIIRYNATEIILIDLISYIPFLPFIINKKVKVRGILYRIYLYEWKESSILKKIQDVIKYVLFAHFKVFNKVFILNDFSSAYYLNRLYKTRVFYYLPDPVASSADYLGKDIRRNYSIDKNKIVFLHPGGMLPYKGTVEILDALTMMDNERLSKISIIFAGRITDNIRDAFFERYNQLRSRVQIVLLEGYLPFESLADLFVSCDYVLIPYRVKGQSSGIVGHAAYYNKPVVVAKGGIIGKTVRKWHLGPIIENPSSECIKEFLSSPNPFSSQGKSYVESHSIETFCEFIYQEMF